MKPLTRSAAPAASRAAALGYAVRGLGVLLREPNARIHVLTALCVTGLGLWLRLEASDWCVLLLAMALVLGAEGPGMRQLTRKNCDELVSIPMKGAVESLNVSVASGVCLYEALRQRT